MRKSIYCTIILGILIGVSGFNSYAQNSVNDSEKYATKLLKKVKSSNFKKFKSSYEEALSTMASIEQKAAQKEFGYDYLADNIDSWISLNTLLSKFDGGKIVLKDQTITLQIKDYTPLKEEAFNNAFKAHFDEGSRLFSEEKEYSKRNKSITHFQKALKYANSDDAKSKCTDEFVAEKQNEINYDEGINLLSGATYEERVKAVKYFEKIEGYKEYKDVNDKISTLYYDQGVALLGSSIFEDQLRAVNCFEKIEGYKEYKDVNDKICTLYYNQGVESMKSDSILVVKKASQYFSNIINNYNSEYKDVVALNTQTKERAASILYNEAIILEKDESFKGQAKAAKMFGNALTWVDGYKDTEDRLQKSKTRSSAKLLCVDPEGRIYSKGDLRYGQLRRSISSDVSDYIEFPNVASKLGQIDMRMEENFKVAKDSLGYGFLVLTLEQEGEFEFTKLPVTTSTEKSFYATISTKDSSGKWKVVEYTDEKKFNNAKSLINAGAKVLTGSAKTKFMAEHKVGTPKTGTARKHIEESRITAKYIIKLIDYRGETVEVVETISTENIKSDKVEWDSYSGAVEAKPSSLRSKDREVKTEVELIESATSMNNLSLKKAVAGTQRSGITKLLNNNIKFR